MEVVERWRRRTPLMPYIPAAAVLLVSVLLMQSHRAYRDAVLRVIAAEAALDALNTASAALRLAESSQRGFVITGGETFLNDYEAAVPVVERGLADLHDALEDSQDSTLLPRIDRAARDRLRFADLVVETRQREGADSAAALIRTLEGRVSMEAFRSSGDYLRQRRTSLRESWTETAAHRAAIMNWTIVAGSLLAAGSATVVSARLAGVADEREREAEARAAANVELRQRSTELELQAVQLEDQAAELEELTQVAQENEHRFRALVENSADIIMLISESGEITYTSPAIQRVVGYRVSDLDFKAALLVHPDDRETVEALFNRSRGGHTESAEVRCRRKDGTWCQLFIAVRGLLDDPAVDGYVVNVRDITHERQVESELRQSQKMDAVGRLAGGVAHDFNNLLTAIHGHAELAATDASEAVRAELQEIRRAAAIAASLTRQLLAFSRQQVFRPVPIAVNPLVQDAARMLGRVLGDDVRLGLDLAPEAGIIMADATQVQQILLNLVINARDAMPDGGAITIRTGIISHAGDDRDMSGPAEYVRIRVEDTGHGMSPEVQEQIFEPFFTTKPEGHGTGLGLSTVYGIVKQLGGHVSVTSVAGVGTQFHVDLPRTSSKPAASVSPESPATRSVAGASLLLVEDDGGVSNFARRVLARAGAHVRSASNAEEALSLIAAGGTAVDLIVTDVVMPGMSGAQFARELRSRGNETPILYTSGYSRQEITERGKLPDAVGFLQKPYSISELLDAVGQALGGPGGQRST